MTATPSHTLPPELERLLATHPQRVADAIRARVADVRPCVVADSTRASKVPLRGSWIDRLRGRPRPAPVLSPIVSKFGGVPYQEGGEQVEGCRFVGQVNFAEVSEAAARKPFPMPAGMPSSGLLAVYLSDAMGRGKVCWYPAPAEHKAIGTSVECAGKYEARLQFRASSSLQGLDWYAAVPKGDHALWEQLNNLEFPGVDEDYCHRLFGHTSNALNDHYGLTPVPGRSSSIRDYAQVWRIDCDPPAGISWGTNWLYVVIHRDDLAQGAFENAIVTGANS